MKKHKAVFLDRDGTIITHIPYLNSPQQLQLLPNAAEGIRLFKKRGFWVIVVTNQSGIARGYFDETCLNQIHDKLISMLKKKGAALDGLYYCPHYIDGIVEKYKVACECRKPGTKMLSDAAQKYNIDLARSVMIGDSLVDIRVGKQAGCKSILIGHASENKEDDRQGADFAVRDLLEAANLFIEYETYS